MIRRNIDLCLLFSNYEAVWPEQPTLYHDKGGSKCLSIRARHGGGTQKRVAPARVESAPDGFLAGGDKHDLECWWLQQSKDSANRQSSLTGAPGVHHSGFTQYIWDHVPRSGSLWSIG